jgi:hypothetical protein
MILWSRIRSWLSATLRRSRMESEMDAELRFHVEAYAEDLVRGGITREEAMRRARLEFGGIERVKEEGREARGVTFFETLVQDLRYGATAELWTPLQYDGRNIISFQSREWGHHLRMLGRVRPGISKEQARRELESIAHNPVREFPRPPWASLEQGLIVNSLQHDLTVGVRPALLAALAAVTLVLLIACVNVTNLLLARGAQRRGEFAVRTALGAGRMRMMRQLLTESLLLATFGGALGMAIAEFGVRALAALSPPGLPQAGAPTGRHRIRVRIFDYHAGRADDWADSAPARFADRSA